MVVNAGPSAPVAGFTYLGTGSPNEFSFLSTSTADPDASIVKYSWDFGDGTTLPDGPANPTHTFAPAASHVVRLTVTDSSGLTGNAEVTITNKLKISQVLIDPEPASAGADDVVATVTVRNDGASALTGVTATMASTTPDLLAVTSGPDPATATVAPGASQDFGFGLSAVTDGTAKLSVAAHGDDAGAVVTDGPVSRDLIIGGDRLSSALTLDKNRMPVGTSTDAHLTVTNRSGHAVTLLVPTLKVSPTDDATVTGPRGGSDTLASDASTTFDFTVTASKVGTLSVEGSAAGTIPFDGSEVASPTVSKDLAITPPSIVVNDAGDAEDVDLTDHLCDVDPVAEDEQCTLRAAIQESNTRFGSGDGAQVITFDLPGTGLPVIRPSALPPVTAQATIDGSTQPGGSVAVVGSAGTGLQLVADQTGVRGLVLSGWSTGLELRGNQQSVRASRVGVDSTLDVTSPNGVGIDVSGADAVIGGPSPDDGNLVAGNTTAGLSLGGPRPQVQGNRLGVSADGLTAVTNGTGATDLLLDGPTGAVLGGPSNVTDGVACAGPCNQFGGGITLVKSTGVTSTVIAGNVFCAGPSGENFRRDCATSVDLSGGRGTTMLGGDTSALGNVVIGNVVVDHPQETADFTVRSNLIGVTPDGRYGRGGVVTNSVGTMTVGPSETRSVATPGAAQSNVIADGVSASHGHTTVVGNVIGEDPTATRDTSPGHSGDGIEVRGGGASINGNAIGGFETGILTDQIDSRSTVRGNRIGTNGQATAAVPNGRGMIIGATSSWMEVSANVISGNGGSGVILRDDDTGVRRWFNGYFSAGNSIGVDVTGERAIPNAGAGLEIHGGQIREGCASCEQDLVAGNRGPGVVLEDLSQPLFASGPCNFTNLTIGLKASASGVGPVGPSGVLPNGGPALVASRVDGVAFGTWWRRSSEHESTYGDARTVVAGPQGALLVDASHITGTLTALFTDGPGIEVTGTSRSVDLSARLFHTGAGVWGTRGVGGDPSGVAVRVLEAREVASGPLLDLGGDGPTPNDDPRDADSGPNALVNSPVSIVAANVPATRGRPRAGVIRGRLDSIGFGTVSSWAYLGPRCRDDGTMADADGFPAGELGRPTTSAFPFEVHTSQRLSVGQYLALSEIDNDGAISEPSACVQIMAGTITTAAAEVGDHEVAVSTQDGFQVGDHVIVDPNGPAEERATVSAFGSLVFSSPLTLAHPTGTLIVDLDVHPDNTPDPTSPVPSSPTIPGTPADANRPTGANFPAPTATGTAPYPQSGASANLATSGRAAAAPLARTGSNIGAILLVASALLVAGAAALAFSLLGGEAPAGSRRWRAGPHRLWGRASTG